MSICLKKLLINLKIKMYSDYKTFYSKNLKYNNNIFFKVCNNNYNNNNN